MVNILKKSIILSLILITFCFCTTCFAEDASSAEPILVPATFSFSWDITANEDVEMYYLFRSKKDDSWGDLNCRQTAFALGNFKDSKRKVCCYESGIWYWALRSVDSAGNVSDISNIVTTLVDVDSPAAPQHFEVEIMDIGR